MTPSTSRSSSGGQLRRHSPQVGRPRPRPLIRESRRARSGRWGGWQVWSSRPPRTPRSGDVRRRGAGDLLSRERGGGRDHRLGGHRPLRSGLASGPEPRANRGHPGPAEQCRWNQVRQSSSRGARRTSRTADSGAARAEGARMRRLRRPISLFSRLTATLVGHSGRFRVRSVRTAIPDWRAARSSVSALRGRGALIDQAHKQSNPNERWWLHI
jgi:hypothetical protein